MEVSPLTRPGALWKKRQRIVLDDVSIRVTTTMLFLRLSQEITFINWFYVSQSQTKTILIITVVNNAVTQKELEFKIYSPHKARENTSKPSRI